MTMQNNDDTLPAESPENQSEGKKTSRPRRGKWIWLGILILILGAAAGGWLGYSSGIRARKAMEINQLTAVTTTQFELGLADITDGHLAMAQQRFEYVLSLDPTFPGASDKLAEVMIKQAQVSTVTPMPSPTVSPTPDLRGVEEIYNQAVEQVKNKQWAQAFDSLQALRNEDATYKAVDVDGLYYVVLRYRGVEMILNEGNLEGGIYDLTLAEKFAPIDADANSYRTWARYYLNGASYWGIDWGQVVSIFSEIYPAFPNLRDGSGMTATERYRLAAVKYGDQLMLQEDYCKAQEMYQLALDLSPDPVVQPTADEAGRRCSEGNAPTAQPQPGVTVTPSPTTEVSPTETPTVETPSVETTTEVPLPTP
ncbi:tetratricopeptide repeat protein [Longilinea arvoryzae]|nr:hypothetical protein [Longilinea arvoryzae]